MEQPPQSAVCGASCCSCSPRARASVRLLRSCRRSSLRRRHRRSTIAFRHHHTILGRMLPALCAPRTSMSLYGAMSGKRICVWLRRTERVLFCRVLERQHSPALDEERGLQDGRRDRVHETRPVTRSVLEPAVPRGSGLREITVPGNDALDICQSGTEKQCQTDWRSREELRGTCTLSARSLCSAPYRPERTSNPSQS